MDNENSVSQENEGLAFVFILCWNEEKTFHNFSQTQDPPQHRQLHHIQGIHLGWGRPRFKALLQMRQCRDLNLGLPHPRSVSSGPAESLTDLGRAHTDTGSLCIGLNAGWAHRYGQVHTDEPSTINQSKSMKIIKVKDMNSPWGKDCLCVYVLRVCVYTQHLGTMGP